MKITEINGTDNTVIEREATEEEIAQIIADQDAAQAAKDAEAAKAAELAATKAAILTKLGVTEDEFKAALS